jgi:hypothetical protein
MIPNINIVKGEVKTSQIIDTRGVAWSPFELPDNMPMMNPVSWELSGEWENGFHLTNQALIEVKDNKIITAYRITPICKENGDIIGSPFKI